MAHPIAPIIDASTLHAWYGSSHVLHGVDIANAGETLGLLAATAWASRRLSARCSAT
jgi:hypothetical protein